MVLKKHEFMPESGNVDTSVRCKNLALNIRDCVPPVGRCSSVVGASLRNLGKFVSPTLPVSLEADTESRWSLLFGVYARGSKISHNGGKRITCRGFYNSELNHSCVSPRMDCLEYT